MSKLTDKKVKKFNKKKFDNSYINFINIAVVEF